MLNIKVTNRMQHEDYIAQADVAPFVLPRKHIISVVATITLSALIVLPLPSTWERFDNDSAFTSDSRDYLSEDQSAQEMMANNAVPNLHQENYDDYDIPSQYFNKDAQKLADSTTLDNIFIDEQDEEDDEEIFATTPSTDIEGSWADGNKEAATEEELAQSQLETDESTAMPTTGTDTGSQDMLAQSKEPSTSTSTTSPAPDSSVASKDDEPLLAQQEQGKDTTADTGADESSKLTDPANKLDTSKLEDPKLLAKGDASKADAKAKADGSKGETLTASTGTGAGTSEPDVLLKIPEHIAKAKLRPTGEWYRQTINAGDSLSEIFNYLDLPYATLNRITKVAGKRDLFLKVGDPIYFLVDKENVVMEMVKPISKTEQVRFTRFASTDDFTVVYEDLNKHVADESMLANIKDAVTMPIAVEALKQREIKQAALAKARAEQEARDRANNVNPNRPRLVIAKIEKGENFARASHRAGLTPTEVKTINQIFKKKLNTRKLKAGDSFRVLFSGIGTKAKLYAVKFDTSKGRFESFINPDDQNYYGENEFTPTAGIFRRFPLADEIKVTSHFNPSRRHPVTKRVMPHNGVDFKASVGTPVYAPADGVVTFSGYQRAAGYYVIVSHSNNFSTVYMHLSKSEVKRGQKVIVGQLIARSGNTGRTTGPHLHYEIRINDRPVNPLKIELPSSNHPNLAREQREAFANNVKVLRSELQNDKLADLKK